MYPWITHTWNTVKGRCPHGCSYCYMNRWGSLRPVRFDTKELKTDLGEGNFVFVGSSCDLFASSIPDEWIEKTLVKCQGYSNRFLFQSKNPFRMAAFLSKDLLNRPFVCCTTLETNRWYPSVMYNSPTPTQRVEGMSSLPATISRYVTIEPILDFDLVSFVGMIQSIGPAQVNIGADSGNNNLPEPSAGKVYDLIEELSRFTTIARKSNLGRLLS